MKEFLVQFPHLLCQVRKEMRRARAKARAKAEKEKERRAAKGCAKDSFEWL
jgi:hypothetical protein